MALAMADAALPGHDGHGPTPADAALARPTALLGLGSDSCHG
jgi:hypothetical protein